MGHCRNEKKLADNCAAIVPPSKAELAAMAKKVRAEVWPEIISDVGADWAEAILDKSAT